ncbi:MBL fold metallo-hydrolase [Gloeocapsa sp. PCC 73106]|uniref:MBL fold metallo-hydrolase n=1 Tax=Gloeocapsa sp. PCC 73106 TaxID=102232 RepID=UPI0002ABF11E|nr:MBL fold metallo-hydrolase [Gloeocapsa sp. PCC 73106]ELR99317.1 putative exonuclease of the beta-lactamase fold involved in RNA processing [Gloeocapsa sp. PCC 73106]
MIQSPDQLSCYTYGVGHTDNEGICLLIHFGNDRVLLDCGLNDLQPLLIGDQPPADWVICSHAHRDHTRGLLALHKAFPELPIYASSVTSKLLPLNWLDTRVPESLCQSLEWRSPLKLNRHLKVELFPAGHLPGAACILLTYSTSKRTYKLLYTGDFCLSNLQLVEGLSLESIRGIAPDVLIVEGSYGTSRHPHRRHQEKHLMERLKKAIDNRQSVLLPVPILGLAQEILKLLRSHYQFTGKDLDIWVDKAVGAACDRYLDILSYLPASVQNFAKHQALFWDERVCPRMGQLSSTQISKLGQIPAIVMTDSLTDLSRYCHSGPWLILVPEQQYTDDLASLESLGNIELDTYLLADHSDSRNTTQLIHNLRPQHIIFVHGSPNYLADLTSLEELQNRYQLHSPDQNVLVDLPLGEKFIQPIIPRQNQYDGELNEDNSLITITLPQSITGDSRWQNFGDTGIIEARWQGEELVIRGVTQKELLQQGNQGRKRTDIDCCNICYYYRNQRCWNQASPLWGFKVTADGCCPVFEALEQY